MAENYADISCEDVIYSEDYRDYIKEYFQDFSSIAGTYHPVCIEAIGSRYAVMHLAGDTSMQNILSDYNISMLPALYGLLGTAGLEESGAPGTAESRKCSAGTLLPLQTGSAAASGRTCNDGY